VPRAQDGVLIAGGDPDVGQVKLWLWSRNPFDYTRHGGRAWEDWFTDRFPDYPCLPPPPVVEVCYDFMRLEVGFEPRSPWRHLEEPALTFAWDAPAVARVSGLSAPVEHRPKALCFTAQARVTLTLPRAARRVRLLVVSSDRVTVTFGPAVGETLDPASSVRHFEGPQGPALDLQGQGIEMVELSPKG
jgi:hypothetical protein